jgi:hypothetical protein
MPDNTFQSGHSRATTNGGQTYTVGYGRPPKATQFQSGRSGNPKGRPKGSRSVLAKLREVYTDKVSINDGQKRRRVSRIEALLLKQWQRGVQGNERATQAAIKNAEAFGVLYEAAPETLPDKDNLTDKTLGRLSEGALMELLEIANEDEAN